MLKVTVLGAGSIGCYVAGCLLANQTRRCKLTLIGRQRIKHAIEQHGLRVTDWQGRNQLVTATNISISTQPDAMSEADVILLCVKSQDTETAADLIKQWAKPSSIVVSLQNGVSNVGLLRQLLSNHIVPGMVPFNVFYKGEGHFHCGTEGNIAVEDPSGLCKSLIQIFEEASLPVAVYHNLLPVQYGKLIMNLNNAVNALSGIPLKQQLSERDYRLVTAKVLAEALSVLNAEGIKPARTGKVIPKLMPTIMKLPNAVFQLVAASTLKIDPEARSSMFEDLALGRKTEIDFLNGEIVRLGRKNNISTPVNDHIVLLIKQCESHKKGSPCLPAEHLLPA